MIKCFKCVFLTYLFLQVVIPYLHSQTVEPNFDQLTIAVPNCVLQDIKVFIWIGAQEGLIRYDGYKLKKYRNIPFDSTSLSATWVTTLAADKWGNLWVGTYGGGLNYFNQITERFTHFNLEIKDDSTISSKSITKIIVNEDGSLWIGTLDCGLFYARTDNTGRPEFSYFDLTDSLSHRDPGVKIWILDLYKDDTNCLWIGTKIHGLKKLNPKTGQITHFIHDPNNPSSLSHNSVRAICADSLGNIWIGTGEETIGHGGGLNMYHRGNGKFIHFQNNPADLTSLFSDRVYPILIDSKGFLWMNFPNEGLVSIPISELLSNNKPDFRKLKRHKLYSIQSIYEDHLGNIWFTQFGRNLYKYDRQQNPFTWFHREKGNSNTMSSSSTECLYIDRSRNIWIGHHNTGLDKYDPKTGLYTNYLPRPNDPNFLNAEWITGIQEDSSGFLWIGTMGHGLYRMNPKKETFQHYRSRPGESDGLDTDLIYLMLLSKTGNLWLSTMDKGLILYDPESNRAKHIDIDPSSSEDDKIISMYDDRDGTIWLGTIESGLYGIEVVNDEIQSVQHYIHNPLNQNSLSYNNICDIIRPTILDTHALWIATAMGLNRFDLRTKSFTHFFEKDGIPHNLVLKVLEDNQGNIWMAGAIGIGMYDMKTGRCKSYGFSDGLPFETFAGARQIAAKDADGQLFFSGSSGTVAFFPEKMKDNPVIPAIRLTDFKIFHESIKLDTAIQFKKTITLTHHQNVFSLEFTALNYTNPGKNQYAYKMEGFYEDWIDIGTERTASFTNLDPGHYVFRVKGSNNHGVWNENGTSISIIILPPWWRTSWAYLFYVLLAGAIICGLHRYDLKRQRLKYQLTLEQEHTEKLEEIDRLKSRFFANISHEFRTPLTLIMGPLNKWLPHLKNLELKTDLNLIQRHAQRLLRLINQLLDLSRLESGGITLQLQEENIVPLLRGYVQAFESLARLKNITLEFTAVDDQIVMLADRDKIEKIMDNLLSNAFKYTPQGGRVVVKLSLTTISVPLPDKGRTTEGVEITISDTGRGIPADKLPNIFDRFYRVDSGHVQDQDGSGIGLALTKELVELHQGQIEVQSKVNQGATFILRLPLNLTTLNRDNTHREPSIEIPKELPEVETKIQPALNSKAEISPKAPLILVIEDNQDVRYYIKDHLQPDFRIVEAVNGQDGLQKAIQAIPDLIISDVMMPAMDGFELSKQIKTDERTSHIPVILLTARAGSEDKINGLETGADDYLTKPFDARELRVRIQNLIKQRQKLREYYQKHYEFSHYQLPGISATQAFHDRALQIVEHYLSDDHFKVTHFAREMGYSPSQLTRKLAALTGMSPSRFIRSHRLLHARNMLQRREDNISQIAYACGFINLSYFSRIFKEQFGQLPSEFLKHH